MGQPYVFRTLASSIVAMLLIAQGSACRADEGWVANFPSAPAPRADELKKKISNMESTGTISAERADQLRNELQQIQKSRTLFRTAIEDLALWENMLLNRDLDHVSATLDQASREARPGSAPVVSSADANRAFDTWPHAVPDSSQFKVDSARKAAPWESPDMVP